MLTSRRIEIVSGIAIFVVAIGFLLETLSEQYAAVDATLSTGSMYYPRLLLAVMLGLATVHVVRAMAVKVNVMTELVARPPRALILRTALLAVAAAIFALVFGRLPFLALAIVFCGAVRLLFPGGKLIWSLVTVIGLPVGVYSVFSGLLHIPLD